MARFFALCFIGLLFLLWNPTEVLAYYTNMPASIVIGQSNFSNQDINQGGSAGANTLNASEYTSTDGTRLFVSDRDNNRVLIWNKIPTQSNTSADVVIGQNSFTGTSANQGGTAAANTLSAPRIVFSDGMKLIIADTGNHRVLIFNTIPTTNNASADVVVGQTTFSGTTVNQGGSVGANTISTPRSAFFDGTKLYIADQGSSRILIFNSIPTTNNASADVVIGQANFTNSSANQGGGATAAANTLSAPTSVFVQDNKLFTTDENNRRVLIFNSIPTTNNASADVVIGQANFVASSSNQGGSVGANTLGGATRHVIVFDGRLFIADGGNNRILIYNSIPTTNNASADLAIGQINLSSGTVNSPSGSINEKGFSGSRSMAITRDKLMVADVNNRRVLIFDNVLSGPQLSMNIPEAIGNEKLKVSGSVQLGERGKYGLQRMQANVNGQGFSNVSYLSGGRDLSSDQTGYDFYHEFESWAGISAKDQYDPSKGYTLNLKASSFNAEEDQIFYFTPFSIKSIVGSQINLNINKDHWERIKNSLDSFEIQQKKGTTWTTIADKIVLDPEIIKTTKTLSGEVRVVTKDKWGHRQSITNSINTRVGISSYNLNTMQVTSGFPLQINSISGFNTGIISTYMSISRNTFVSSTSKPTFSGIAYAGSTITVLITDPVVGRSTTFTTITKSDSKWSLPVILYSTSVIDTWVSLGDKYTELPTFKLSVVRSEQ